MICHEKDLPGELDAGEAVVVIGSGPVGLVIARRLAELGVPAWVIEAGAEHATAEERDSLVADFDAQRLPGTLVGRTRQLGGGLNLWGGQLARFHPDELDGGKAAGWPIAPDALARPLDDAMRLLGQAKWPAAPPPQVAAAALEAARFDLEPVVTTWLKEPKWSSAVWSELRQAPSIRVVLGLAIDGIRLDETRSHVVGLTARTRDGAARTIRANRVVIAAGTVESARLLLQPDQQGAAQPWHALPWLGRGLSEHLNAPVATVTIKRAKPIADLFDPALSGGIKQTWKLFGRVPLGNGEEASGVILLGLPGSVRNAIAELVMLLRGLTPRSASSRASRIFKAGFASAREVLPLAWRYLRHKRLGTALRGQAILWASIEQRPRWENRMTLSDNRDRLGIRRIRIDWKTGRDEGEAFLVLARRACAWLEASGAGAPVLDPDLVGDPAAFAARAEDGLHLSGGARIGTSPENSVVDIDLGIHGTADLYVCGAAVFPRPGFANPTLMASALGARLAEHLAGRARA